MKKRLGPKWSGRNRPLAGHLTRRLAEARLRELVAEAQRGVLPVQGIAGATFGEACEEWLRYVKHDRGRRSTVSDYRSVVFHDLLPGFGAKTPLVSITVDRVDAYRARLVAEGRLSNRTINKHLVLLNGIFKRAQRVWSWRSTPHPRWTGSR